MSVHAPHQPRYAPMRQLPVAVVHPPIGRRLLAQLCDTLIVLGPGALAYVLTKNPVLAGVISLQLVLAQIVSEARCGATIGKWLLGLRAAKVNSLYAPGLARGVVRALMLGLGHLVAGVGQFVMIAAAAADSERGQGWHDRPARTTVLDVRAGLRASTFSGVDRVAVERADTSATADPAASVDAAADSGRRAPAAPAPATFAPAGPTTPVPSVGKVPQGVPARPDVPPAGPAPSIPPGPSAAAAAVPPMPPMPPVPAVPHTPPPAAPAPAPAAAPPAPAAFPTDSAAAVPPAPQPAAVPPAPGALRLVGQGTAPILIGGTVFVGRAPAAPAGAAATAVPIHDDQRSLSRTHARLEAHGGELVITDLGSANGTFLIAADGSAQQLESGRPVAVPPGTTLALGSKVFTVQAG